MQKLLGFQRYLYVFAQYKIKTLKSDSNEKDFFTFLSLLKDGEGDVLDIGANIGIMSVHLSQALPNSTIYAFEPMPDNLAVLKQIIAKYELKNVNIEPVAVGDQEGKLSMVLPHNGKTKMQGLSHVKHESIKEWNEGDEFEVDSITLDKHYSELKIQGIKIDIENFEYFAFKGGQELIASNRPIIYAELWDNENRTNCFTLLTELGYSINVVVNGALEKFNPQNHTAQNFLFLPN